MFIFLFNRHGILAGTRSKMTSKMVDYSSRDSPYISDEQHGHEKYPKIADTLGILKAEIRIWKEDNDKII